LNMNTSTFRRHLATLPLLLIIMGGHPSHAEGNTPIWTLTDPIPFEEQPDPSGLGIYERAELSASQQQIERARDEFQEAYRQNPADHRIRYRYAWFLYANGFHNK